MSESSNPLIWRFTDGKAGHENQSLALVENLQQLAPFGRKDIAVAEWSWSSFGKDSRRPALVLGAGHRTHFPILTTARRFDCPSVVIMKPSIPRALFDLCLIPQHDLTGEPADNVLPTHGMLNRLPQELPPKKDRGVILIGGPSKHHDWDAPSMIASIRHILACRPELAWHLTNSRRTPHGFLELLDGLDLTVHPCEETGPDWLPNQLIAAREVWVSEDSMSMIYEALTAQARVGLLSVPRKSDRGRIVRGINQLVAGKWVQPFATWDGQELPPPPETIHEASRCAREILLRFFPALT